MIQSAASAKLWKKVPSQRRAEPVRWNRAQADSTAAYATCLAYFIVQVNFLSWIIERSDESRQISPKSKTRCPVQIMLCATTSSAELKVSTVFLLVGTQYLECLVVEAVIVTLHQHHVGGVDFSR